MSDDSQATEVEVEVRTDDADSGPLRRAYDTVTPSYAPHPDAEMDAIGWVLFLGIVFLLVPFLPLILLVWLISKVAEAVARR